MQGSREVSVGVTTLEGQVRRVYVNTSSRSTRWKWVYLANLRDRNGCCFTGC